jgi:hypothetical protein
MQFTLKKICNHYLKSILTLVINLYSKLYDDKRSLTCTIIVTPNVSIASKSHTITWQGTHIEFMKLITRTNLSCLNLAIRICIFFTRNFGQKIFILYKCKKNVLVILGKSF